MKTWTPWKSFPRINESFYSDLDSLEVISTHKQLPSIFVSIFDLIISIVPKHLSFYLFSPTSLSFSLLVCNGYNCIVPFPFKEKVLQCQWWCLNIVSFSLKFELCRMAHIVGRLKYFCFSSNPIRALKAATMILNLTAADNGASLTVWWTYPFKHTTVGLYRYHLMRSFRVWTNEARIFSPCQFWNSIVGNSIQFTVCSW